MSDKRYAVPDGMLKAACDAPSAIPGFQTSMERILEAALRWLGGELERLQNSNVTPWQAGYNVALDDIHRMFLAPEPEVLEEIKDLVWDNRGYAQDHVMKKHKEEILEAYRRGLAAAGMKEKYANRG